MSEIKTNKSESNNNEKRSWFLFFFFFLILPMIGVVVELIAFKFKSALLILIAIPMLLSFFITPGIAIYKSVKAAKEAGVEPEEEDDYYENNLNMDDKVILSYEENPYKKDAVKALIIVASAILVPSLFAYILKDSNLMIFGLYLNNIFSALPIFLSMWTFPKYWVNFENYFEFKRAKKILTYKEKGEKKPFLLPRINLLSFLFLLLTVVTLVFTFKDIFTLNDYKTNGVAVDAVSYHVEKDGDDNYVYFKYNYNGEEYSYVKMNYAGGTKIGNKVKAYIYPDKPEELYLYYSSSFAVYIMLTGALFFLWMGNGYKKRLLAACLFTEGVVAMILGFAEGTTGNKVWGTIFLVCALLTWVSCLKNATKKPSTN